MQLKQHLTRSLSFTHTLTWHVPAPHPASISLSNVSFLRRKQEEAEEEEEEKSGQMKACTGLTVCEPDNFIYGEGVVTTCAADAKFCLPYQRVRPKGRLIIHEESGWARQVNHSSACVFVAMEMEIDAPETLTLSQSALVEGGEGRVGCLFSTRPDDDCYDMQNRHVQISPGSTISGGI